MQRRNKTCVAAAVFLTLFGGVFTGKLPPEYKICERVEDNELNKCLKSAIQDALLKIKNGIPSLKVAPVEPLVIPEATLGEGKGPVHVVQNYKNLKIYGLFGAKIKDTELLFTNTTFKLSIKGLTPELRIEADYNMDGQILVLPIKGEGKCTITLKNLEFTLILFGESYQKKGKTYLKVTHNEHSIGSELVTYKFDNLFNGDAVLGNQINALLNENWKEVFEDVRPGWEEVIGKVIANYVHSLFSKVPLADLFPTPAS